MRVVPRENNPVPEYENIPGAVFYCLIKNKESGESNSFVQML